MSESNDAMQTVSLDVGEYTGHFLEGMPHGQGTLTYNETDPIGRHKYEGAWREGRQEGAAGCIMHFRSGDVFEGAFLGGVPHGENGCFRYVNGDVETCGWEDGQRHGLSIYQSKQNNSEEQITFCQGVAQGSSTYKNLSDGSIETREFRDGVKSGPARVEFPNGDFFQLNYENNELNGKATLHFISRDVIEECHYVSGTKCGPSVELKGGDREERAYQDGQLEGPALVVGANGDKLEFTYHKGKRTGGAKYFWSDGSVELCQYDDQGVQNGPAKLTWPNGAIREGQKKDGQWHGEVLYTYAEGPRKGKKDLEIWEEGKMTKSQKFYGHGIEVEDWEDLKKLEDLTKPSSPSS